MIVDLAFAEPLVILIKLADRLHNMRSVYVLRPEKQRRCGGLVFSRWVRAEHNLRAVPMPLPEECKKCDEGGPGRGFAGSGAGCTQQVFSCSRLPSATQHAQPPHNLLLVCILLSACAVFRRRRWKCGAPWRSHLAGMP